MKIKVIFSAIAFLFFFAFTNNANAQKSKKRHVKRHIKKHVKHRKARRVAHYKYRHLPRRGKVVAWTYGTKFVRATHKGIGYRFHKGVWYKAKGSKFAVIRAPFGVRVKILPVDHKKIKIGSRPYFYYYGTFYKKSDGTEEEYVVVNAPIGAEVDALPEGYEITEVVETEYYKFDDTYYKPMVNDNDEEYYVVVKNPNE